MRRLFPLDLRKTRSFAISSDAKARILFPPPDFVASSADDQALVVQVTVSGTPILFMSDSGYSTERFLLESSSGLRSDVLIKGQHHSGKSGSEIFLDAVRPQLVIATSRDFPQQERISDEWVERLRARGTKLFRQDETGAIEIRVGEHDWQARSYLTGEIFRSDNR